jgi:hypothetical protein
MTHDFAARLWLVTQLGVRVVVARNDVVPTEFSNPHLFAPKVKPADMPEVTKEPEQQRSGSLDPVKLALATNAPQAKPAGVSDVDNAPAPASIELRGAIAAGNPAAVETASTDVVPTAEAGEKPAEPAAAAAAPVPIEVHSDVADPPKPAPDASDPPKSAPPPPSPKNRAAAQPPKRSGEVAVFISRKEKKLYVRQGFAPVFDVPVTIEHPEQPLGTHVFTAMAITDNGTHVRWNVMSLPAEPAHPLIPPKIGSKSAPPARPAEVFAPQTAAQALDRIQIPQEAMDRIGEIMAPGTSLIISDQGLGGETGSGTDFVVLTR